MFLKIVCTNQLIGWFIEIYDGLFVFKYIYYFIVNIFQTCKKKKKLNIKTKKP